MSRPAKPASPNCQRPILSRRVLLGVLPAGLAGCGSLIPFGEAPNLHTLTPKSSFDDNLPTVGWQLLIEPPFAAAALDTVRIAVLTATTSVDYYAGVAWTDLAPEMVQTLIVESFENSGRIVAVGRETVGLRADFVLSTELREFQAERLGDGSVQVRVRINAKLIYAVRRAIVANTTLEFVAPVAAPGFDQVILAFDEALGKVLRRLVAWTLIEGNTTDLAVRAG